MSDSLKVLETWLNRSIKSAALGDEADAGTQPAATGERAAENTADVKATVPGQPVDSAPLPSSGAPGGDNTPSNSIGTEKSPTGEDPKNETASASLTQLDPGTSHPAKAGSVEELRKLAASILADYAMAQAAPEAPAAPAAVAKTAAAVAPVAQTPAAVVTPTAVDAAGDAEKSAMLQEIVKNACLAGDNVAEYLMGFVKASEGEISDPELQALLAGEGGAATGEVPPGLPGEMPPDAGMVDPAAGGDGSGQPQLSEEDLAALAQLLAEAGIGGEGGGAPAPAAEAPPAPPAAEAPPAEEPKAEEPKAEDKMASLKAAFAKLSTAKKQAFVEKVLKAVAPKAK